MTGNSTKTNYLKWLLPLLVLILAIPATIAITKSRKAPEKQVRKEQGLLVETQRVVRRAAKALVHTTGTVEPQLEISMVAEVSGRLVWTSPRFTEGGFFRQGEKLLTIDARDYQLALQRAEAELARARVGLQTAKEHSDIALREWRRIELPGKGEPSPLVLRQPQYDEARANFAAAEAALAQARLNLERTNIRAPFNGRISSKKVDRGEFIRSGNPLAVFSGTDQAEIIAPLPLEDLRWLDIPAAGSMEEGSSCRVSARIGAREHRWTGSISRSFAEIDHNSRMAKIAIRIEDPYRLTKGNNEQGLALITGLFVDIEIEGASLDQVASIPRSALREGDVVWLADENDLLEIRPVRVLRRQQQSLLIDQGLQGGERLILTHISGPATGLKLRPQDREQRQ